MAISANDIRKGMVILHEGAPVKVMDFHHHTPGNLRAMVQARLRNLLTGNSFEYRFRSNDTLERVVLEQHKMEYLYSDEGQLGWLKGYCHPIRFNAMAEAGVLPEELMAKLPAADNYAKAVFPSIEEQNANKATITTGWDSTVGASVQ